MVIKRIRDAIQIVPLILLLQLTKRFSLNYRRKIAALWFKILLFLSRKLRKRVESNLSLAMPNIRGQKKKSFFKEFAHFSGSTFIELIFNKEFHESSGSFFYSNDDLKPLVVAKQKGRPIIIVSAHLGPWEAVRAVLKNNGLTAGAIYKKNKNQFYERIHLKAIKYGGEPIFPTGTAGTKKMIEYIKSGGIVAVMLDQADEKGEFFEFLGVPAKTSTAIAKIAVKYDALLVPAYAIRDKLSSDIHVHFEKPVETTNYRDLTELITKSIETRVKENPAQWHWFHRRWKY